MTLALTIVTAKHCPLGVLHLLLVTVLVDMAKFIAVGAELLAKGNHNNPEQKY